MLEGLEENLGRIHSGRKIVYDMIYDYLHHENPRFTPGIHATRVDGLNEETSFWEGVGYLSAVAENVLLHPRAMYKLFLKK